MIYYVVTDQFIKQGFTENLSKRIGSHLRAWRGLNAEFIAAMPGDSVRENTLKAHWEPYRWRGESEQFELTSPVVPYVERLLSRQYATTDMSVASQLPELPFSAISPEALLAAVEPTGQMTILDSLRPVERIKYVASQHINYSISDDWHTPPEWVERAREVMGCIDCDPATTLRVNTDTVHARIFYTKEMNGLDKARPWLGKVWLNPPYGRGEYSASAFVRRLGEEIDVGNVTAAVTCLNLGSMSSRWFLSLVQPRAAAHWIGERVDFVAPTGQVQSSPNKGTVFSYFGPDVDRFICVFGQSGPVLVPA